MLYIVIATNMYGVDEAPVVVYDKNLAIEEMKRLMVWGINERASFVIDDFIEYMRTKKRKDVDKDQLDSYDTMLHNKLVDPFFKYLTTRKDYTNETTSMKIRLSDEHECNVYEVGYWEQEE